ncbi:MAG TPA: chemotaxis protein CheA [Nitrospiraceae bacterium]|nr:chemotaxis protein CheA [Nitrospiraceae bacterium]
MSGELSQFNDAFFEEASEHMTNIEDGLLQLEQRPADLDLLNTIFRSAHSIKGVAGMLGFSAVAQFTHKMETLLDQLRTNKLVVTPPVADLLLKCTDCLKALIGAAKGGDHPDQTLVAGLEQQLADYAAGKVPSADPAVHASVATPPKGTAPVQSRPASSPAETVHYQFTIGWTPPGNIFQIGLDPMQVIKDLRNLGTVSHLKADASRLPDLAAMDPERCYLSWSLVLDTAKTQEVVESVFEFVKEDSILSILDTTPDQPMSVAPVPAPPAESEGAHVKPLGEILVESGAVTPEDLNRALSQQKKVGEILVEQHVVTPQQVAQALETQKQAEAAAQAKKADTTTIRVDTAKIDRLINLVGELVITQSMLTDLGKHFSLAKMPLLLERMAQLERNTREIQERVMGIRMLQIGTAFQRFPRLVRDLAQKSGKKIQLVTAGEETELDKSVIESIGDPLTHLIRNSADHGLEPPDERLAAGKPEQGTIKLNAFHEGGNICITVEDDGRGLNRDRILAKAIKQGLVQEGEKLPDDQIWQLIFKPGFSTAEKITDVSGRGVGMDVVKRNIEALGGTVGIKTIPGKGTLFTLKLPLTLAIIDGMTVRVGKELYIIPLVSIVESIQPRPDTIRTIIGQAELINVRGAYHPILRLHQAFHIEPEHTDLLDSILVIVETEGERVAVMVDELVGQQQVVIKSLEKNFRKVQGIAGATILGDGTVGFILDVRGLLDLTRRIEPVAA